MQSFGLKQYFDETLKAVENLDLTSIEGVIEIILKARKQGNTIYTIGNGGSASTASHMAVDLMFGSRLANPYLKVVSLSDNLVSITATGNDLDYEKIFSRQLTQLAKPRDILIAISASGNSRNIIHCVETAKKLELVSVGLTGFDGGELCKIVDYSVHVQTRTGAYGQVEDIHLMISHAIVERLKTY